MKVRHGIAVVLIGIVLFIAGFGTFFWAIAGVRSEPQFSIQQTKVAPHAVSIVEIVAIGRHEFTLESESRFDFSYLTTEREISRYAAGEQFSAVDEAESVRRWETFIQTGRGSKFALLFANPGEREIAVSIIQAAYEDPSGIVAFISFGSILLGVVLALVGTVLVIVRSTKRSAATASGRVVGQPWADKGAQRGPDVVETRGEPVTGGLSCRSCGTEARHGDRFCRSCGATLAPANR